MDLVEDVLDSQLLDRQRRKIGKVDGIVLELEEGQSPRVAYLESGLEIALQTIHPALGRFVAWLRERLGGKVLTNVRISPAAILSAGIDVVVDVDGDETGSFDTEQALARRFLRLRSGK